MLLADRGYDADWIRELAVNKGHRANVPAESNRNKSICFVRTPIEPASWGWRRGVGRELPGHTGAPALDPTCEGLSVKIPWTYSARTDVSL